MRLSTIRNLVKYGKQYHNRIRIINHLNYLSTQLKDGMTIGVNIKKGIIISDDGIKFYIEKIQPEIFFETFGAKIHDVFGNGNGEILIDAGACFGDSSLFYAKRNFKVYAIEPNPTNYAAMLENIKLNPNLKNRITTLHEAIGPNGQIDFSIRSGGIYGGGTLETNKGRIIKIKSVTLATLLKRQKLKYCDYLKMDCKGGERYLTTKDLQKVRKAIKIEYSYNDKEDTKKLINIVKNSGFNVKTYPVFGFTPIDYVGTLYAWKDK